MRKKEAFCIVGLAALTLLAWLVAAPPATGYETYHDPATPGAGYCAECHPTFTGRGDLHDLHVSPFTNTCNLCHTGSGRNNPYTMWSTGVSGLPDTRYGCAGCHGRDYGETIEATYDNGTGPINPAGDPKMSGYGLRRHHQNNGITQCISCHGDVLPHGEGPESLPITQPPYYQSGGGLFTNITGTCNTDGSEDSSPEPNGEDTLGLDNDGDGLIDGADPECGGGGVCGDGTVDPGEDCDDGNTDPGDCCAADCTYEAAGSTCGDPLDTECDNPDSCDGAGVCEANNEAAGFACGDPSDTECDNPDSCDGAGVCDPNNEPAGFACGDQGVECLADDACDGAGECTDNGSEPDGTACGDASDTDCDNPDSCLTGACEPNNEPAGTTCDDGLFCNVDEACDGSGACGGGAPNPCSDGVGCTDDSCDEAADSCVNAANDANCPDDTLFCNGTEFCDPGLDCQSTGDPCPPGEVCNETDDVCETPAVCGNGMVEPGEQCDDGNTLPGDCCAADCTYEAAGSVCGDPSDTECNNPDSCDGVGVCLDNFEPSGFACGDQGVECLVDDACDGAGACTDNGLEPDGTACGDPSSDQCDNADACVAGACDPNWVPAGTACDDGLFCNLDEACDGGGSCGGGSPNLCDDGVSCTDDSCDEGADACVNTANDANCPDDGLFCNGTEFCDPAADCSSTGDPCPPGEVCNETDDVCEAPAECGNGVLDPGEDCDDGNTLPGDCCAADCTYEAAGSSCGDGSDTECDNPDSCDGAGTCESNFELSGFACGDQGVECLVDDACDGAGVCADNGLEPDGTACGDPFADQCNNADSCVAGACDPNWVPAGTACDDGLFCNVDEACDGGGACGGGSPNACDDGVGCTDDSCDEAADSCVNTANDANCPDDAQFCNGTEFCDPALDCQSTGDPCPPGEVCNEVDDVCEAPAECGNGTLEAGEDCDDGNTLPGDCCAADCSWEPAGSVCGDGSDTECNNPDSCDGAGVCLDNFEPAGFACGDQGVECLADDACDGVGVCADNGLEPDGTACGDGSDTECDNPDSCLAGACEPNWEAAGFACGDQGVECLVDDACDGSGVCTDNGSEPDGTACGDPSSDQCDNADSCLSGACDPSWVPAGTTCDDGLFCNVDEACDGGGACGGGGPLDCSNGLYCDGDEVCNEATDSCDSGTPPDCSDGVSCTDDSCNEATDSCDNAPNDANCPDDGMYCNGTEFCDPALDCQSTGDPCPPGEVCNETEDVCEAPPVEVDLDIAQFRVAKRFRLDGKKELVPRLVVRNLGSVDEPRMATVTGMQGGTMVYSEDLMVSDAVGDGRTRYFFLSYVPAEEGELLWTAEIFDDDPDVDVATFVTTVVP